MVRTRTLTIERNEKKMGQLGTSQEALGVSSQSNMNSSRDDVQAWLENAEYNGIKFTNELRVRVYVLHQMIRFARSLDAQVFGAEQDVGGASDIVQKYQAVTEFLGSHTTDKATPDLLKGLYEKVRPLAHAWYHFNGTKDDLVSMGQLCDTFSPDMPLVYPGLEEAAGTVVSLTPYTDKQQADAHQILIDEASGEVATSYIEFAEFFVITEPALVEQFVKEGK